MLPRRAATEIISRDENPAGGKLRIVQDEVRIVRAVVIEAPVGKQVAPQPVLGCGRQKTGRDNLISIDVDRRQYDGA